MIAPDLEDADAATVLRALVMENFNPSIRTVVQILSPRNKEALVQASVDTVVCIDELKMQVLAQNVLCPGFVTIFDNLSSTSGDPDPQGQYQPWFLEYSNGRSLELYSVPLAGPLVGLPFRAAARRVYLSTGGTCLLVGVQEPLAPEQAHAARNAFSSGDGESAFVHVFPDDGYTIGPRTKGIVMAPDARDAATLNDASLFRSLQDSVAQTGAWLTEPAQGGAADAGRVAEQTGADALGGSEAGATASSEARCSSEEGMNEPASAPARRGKARLPARSLLSPPGSPAHRGVAFADGPGSPRVDPASGLVSRVLSTRSLQASLPPLPPNLQGHVLALGTVEHLDALVTSLFHPDLLGTRWEKDVVVLTAVCPPSLMELVHTHPNLYCLLGNPERIEDLEAAGISARPHPESPQFCCSRANPLPTSVPPLPPAAQTASRCVLLSDRYAQRIVDGEALDTRTIFTFLAVENAVAMGKGGKSDFHVTVEASSLSNLRVLNAKRLKRAAAEAKGLARDKGGDPSWDEPNRSRRNRFGLRCGSGPRSADKGRVDFGQTSGRHVLPFFAAGYGFSTQVFDCFACQVRGARSPRTPLGMLSDGCAFPSRPMCPGLLQPPSSGVLGATGSPARGAPSGGAPPRPDAAGPGPAERRGALHEQRRAFAVSGLRASYGCGVPHPHFRRAGLWGMPSSICWSVARS